MTVERREEFLIGEIKKDWRYLRHISEEEQTERVINLAMDLDPWAFRWILDYNKKTLERCLMAVRRSGELLSVCILFDIPVKMQTEEVIDLAIDNDICAFGYIKDESKKTLERCLKAVRSDGGMLKYVPRDMQTEEIINAAMDEDLCAIGYIKDDNKKTLERCLRAVRGYGGMLKYVPKKMQTDAVIDAAIDEDVRAFRYIKDDNKKTLERCLEAVRDNGWMIDYVPDEFRERVEKELGL